MKPSTHSVEKRHRGGSKWRHVKDCESAANAEKWVEFMKDYVEPGEYDGRAFTYRIVDLESNTIMETAK